MESLFGQLCSESTFVHDRRMEALASQQGLKRSRYDHESQVTTSPREESVDSRISSDDENGFANSRRFASVPPSKARNSDMVPRSPKRQRTYMSNTGEDNEGVKRQHKALQDIRRSFEGPNTTNIIGKSTSALPNRSTSLPNPRKGGSVKRLGSEASIPTAGAAPQAAQHFGKNTANMPGGTQDAPIELSDASLPGSDCDDHKAGEFLLEEMPEPESMSNPALGSQPGPETQLSLSDTAFESQSPRHHGKHAHGTSIQDRKHAYKAARSFSGSWDKDYGLMTSFGSHGEEEIEL